MATLAHTRHASATLAHFGEPITLPDGVSLAPGVLDRQGDAISAPWSEVGLRVRQSQQPNPVLYMLDTTADALSEGQILRVGALAYRIALIDPPRGSLTRIELTPDTDTDDEDARWK